MKKSYERFRESGCEVVAVSFAPPEFVALYLKENSLPFPLLSDPERKGYRAFGLDSTTWKDMMRPRVIAQYLRLIVGGWFPRKTREGDDLLQLGGDFILDAERRLVYQYRSTEPTDRPAVDKLLEAASRASA